MTTNDLCDAAIPVGKSIARLPYPVTVQSNAGDPQCQPRLQRQMGRRDLSPHHTLEFDPTRSLLPKGPKPSLDGNLIIVGDNLLALKALLATHSGKIKCVCIDPPYNTGNEAGVYNDNLTQLQFKE
jgi:hypothetical protein